MRILFVAMPESVHTARWISQLAGCGHEVHLFPSKGCGVTSEELRGATVHHFFQAGKKGAHESVVVRGLPAFSEFGAQGASAVVARAFPQWEARRLARLIRSLKPDVVHSLEFQHSAYLTLEARRHFTGDFPPWMVTNWGSDIYLFSRLPGHESRIRAVLAAADYYSCECRRDVCLAKAYGFTGQILPVLPNTGGFDLPMLAALRAPGPSSARRLIVLKGYQHWAGRALVGLRALERCAELLDGYTLAIHSPSPEVEIAAQLFRRSTGIEVRVLPHGTPHREILALHGRARVSLGLSISDGISTSLLEALAMGSFPIQSWTACADEWIVDGRSGLLVPPEDTDAVERALRRALTDDALVELAATENLQTASEKLDHRLLSQRTRELYAAIARERQLA